MVNSIMELVYLWVEDYKNIKNQGFNFSSQFHCEYDEDKSELTIEENQNHIPNFFGKNINITAIVGKNGSGKSSIFEILSLLYWKGSDDKTFFIHRKEDNLYLTCEHYKHIDDKLENFITINNKTTSSFKSPQFFSPRGEMQIISFSNCISDMTENKMFDKLKGYSNFYNGAKPNKPLIQDHYLSSTNELNTKIQHLLKKDKYLFNNEKFYFDSYQFKIHINEYEAYNQGSNTKIKDFISFRNHKKTLSKKEILYKLIISVAYYEVTSLVYYSKYKRELLTIKDPTIDVHEAIKNDIEMNIDNQFISQLKGKKIDINYFTKAIEIYNKYLHKVDKEIKRINEINGKYKLYNTKKILYFDESIFNLKLTDEIIESYSLIEKSSNDFHSKEHNTTGINQSNEVFYSKVFSIRDNEISKHFNNKLFSFLFKNNIIRCNFFNKKINKYDFYNLSSGEKIYLKTLVDYGYTLDHLSTTKNNDFHLILFDEIELSFHPEWQKKILNDLIEIHRKNKNTNIHLLFSSHSPFLLSDIPKQNIIFLNKDKENGNCIIDENAFKNKKETFGSNIHTLLSNSFFMKDGLMGKFAKKRINEIIDFHRETNNGEKTKAEYEGKSNRFWQTQSVVGEPYLKKILKNHLIEIEKKLFGKEIAKKNKIERLRNEIKKLS